MRRAPLCLVLLVVAALTACVDLPTEYTIYLCPVDSDTLHVPSDTTGVVCTKLPIAQ